MFGCCMLGTSKFIRSRRERPGGQCRFMRACWNTVREEISDAALPHRSDEPRRRDNARPGGRTPVKADRSYTLPKRGISAVFGTSALAFVFPFLFVSCGGVEVTRFSGLELAFGTEFQGEQVGPHLELQAALALAVLASVLAWFGATGPAGGFAVIGAGALGLHTFIMKVLMNQNEEDFVSITLRYEIGFWLALSALVVGAVLCASLERKNPRLRQESAERRVRNESSPT